MTTDQHIQRIEVIEAGFLQLLTDLQTIKKELQSECVHTGPTSKENEAAIKAQVRLAYAARVARKAKKKNCIACKIDNDF